MAKQPKGSTFRETFAISTKESRKATKRSFGKGKKKKTKKKARGK